MDPTSFPMAYIADLLVHSFPRARGEQVRSPVLRSWSSMTSETSESAPRTPGARVELLADAATPRRLGPSNIRGQSQGRQSSMFGSHRYERPAETGQAIFKDARTTSVQRARRAFLTQRNHEPNPKTGPCEDERVNQGMMRNSLLMRHEIKFGIRHS